MFRVAGRSSAERVWARGLAGGGGYSGSGFIRVSPVAIKAAYIWRFVMNSGRSLCTRSVSLHSESRIRDLGSGRKSGGFRADYDHDFVMNSGRKIRTMGGPPRSRFRGRGFGSRAGRELGVSGIRVMLHEFGLHTENRAIRRMFQSAFSGHRRFVVFRNSGAKSMYHLHILGPSCTSSRSDSGFGISDRAENPAEFW